MDDFRPLRAAVLGPTGQPLAHHVPPPPPREEPALLPLSFDLSCKHDRTIPFQCQARPVHCVACFPTLRARKVQCRAALRVALGGPTQQQDALPACT